MRKLSIATGVLAFATAGAAVFGGTAIASGDPCACVVHDGQPGKPGQSHSHVTSFTGGDGGKGGDATVQCVLPIGVALPLLGNGATVSQCNPTGGAGGAGGAGLSN